MALRIYSTSTRKKEEFRPIEEGKVKMYVCGPTVYDYIHIGNARPLIFFDAARRHLESLGYDVAYTVNFTDVDDKIINRANEESASAFEIAERYIEAYLEDAKRLKTRPAFHPKVTDTMGEIVAFVSSLIEKGFAYESEGDVYFRAEKQGEYGKVSGQRFSDLIAGARVQENNRKENQQDFALWKSAKPGEISWDSPWGKGRPGWHIECSAMILKHLGETIDIHGGGEDLAFPHHECETAQSESLTGKKLANHWMHNSFVTFNGEKMSKSLKNFKTARDLLGAESPETIRMFVLSVHYRAPLSFSDDALLHARNGVERLKNAVLNAKHALASAGSEEGAEAKAEIRAALSRFREKMNDDFNTADAISELFELASVANRLAESRESQSALEESLRAFETMNDVLGVLPEDEEESLDAWVEALIAEREDARAAKNWPKADEIRKELGDKGIVLEDTPAGVRWKKK